jgi:YD repeat-containing protein
MRRLLIFVPVILLMGCNKPKATGHCSPIKDSAQDQVTTYTWEAGYLKSAIVKGRNSTVNLAYTYGGDRPVKETRIEGGSNVETGYTYTDTAIIVKGTDLSVYHLTNGLVTDWVYNGHLRQKYYWDNAANIGKIEDYNHDTLTSYTNLTYDNKHNPFRNMGFNVPRSLNANNIVSSTTYANGVKTSSATIAYTYDSNGYPIEIRNSGAPAAEYLTYQCEVVR